jgi:hypothetical protein
MTAARASIATPHFEPSSMATAQRIIRLNAGDSCVVQAERCRELTGRH